jgi:peptidyl-prolyl cis-trans isomerase A (cyclophilin A)
MKKIFKRQSAVAALVTALFFSVNANATVVQVQTVLGNFDINLFDQDTPQTVENFLSYVNSSAYVNNVVHRSVPGFVIQAGGFRFDDEFPPVAITTDPPVMNEPTLSNVRGTIAMAKPNGSPDGATSQWFINLADNSTNLDVSNGGFTAFGQVLGDGMDVVDAIAALELLNAGGALNTLPVRNFTQTDVDAGSLPDADNLVVITDVIVTDPATVTNPDIVPVANTLLNAGGGGTPPASGGGGGGGSFGLWAFLLAGLVAARRKVLR